MDSEICTDCKGDGASYYNDNGEQVTKAVFLTLPKGQRDKDLCSMCGGLGKILIPENDFNIFEV
jgi:DnaJ-class molecular chaperone